jgi:hypothetical protein
MDKSSTNPNIEFNAYPESTAKSAESNVTATGFIARRKRSRTGDSVALCRRFRIVVAAIWVLGCGRSSQIPVGDAAENIRKLALSYVQFAAANKGVGPANEESLAKFLAERNGLTREQAQTYFISPRDQQPYVVLWGRRPLSSNPTGEAVPTPSIIIFERTGADGIQYLADGQLRIQQLTADEINRLVPEAKTLGGE